MTGAVVLAAGRGVRAGGPKHALRTGKTSFLDAILRTLSAADIEAVRVVVAPGDRPQEVPPERLVVNPDPSRGMLSSLQCGLRAFRNGLDAILVWPVDHPRVSEATIRALVAAERTRRAPVVIPVHRGRRGHPVLFSSRVLPELLAAPLGEGARAVVHAHADRFEVAVDDPGVADDIDTPADYDRAFPAPQAPLEDAP